MIRRCLGAAALAFGLVAVLPAADTSPGGGTPPVPVPGYITVGELYGTVEKVNANDVVVRIDWKTQQVKNTSRTNQHPHTMQQMQQQMAARARAQASAKVVEHHKDYDLKLAADFAVRMPKLPVKDVDDKGKPVPYTPAEVQKMKGTLGLPGYAIEGKTLQPGMIIEAHVVKLKNPKKDEVDDLYVRWALINDESKAAPAAPAKKDAPKKKN